MSYPAEGPIPIIDLLPAATITVEAVDPTTGATVAGVSFSNGVLYAEGSPGSAADLEGPTPHWLPVGTGGD